MSTLPILLKNPRILLIGGGAVAYHKAQVLVDHQINFHVCAREFSPQFDSLNLTRTVGEATCALLSGFDILVDATGSDAVGTLLREQKQQRFVLVNRVDSPEECDFYFSALLKYGALKIAISSDGASPTMAKVVRNKIERMLPAYLATLVKNTAMLRAQGIIDSAKTRQQTQLQIAQVLLIGCGPGDVNLLTLQAYAQIQQLEVVLYDHLISDEIMAIVPKNVKRVYVGKQKGDHSFKQDEINELLFAYAQQGLHIGRLKSGDPFIFGRGGEEVEYLASRGVRVQVLPGLSSALSGPTLAGIPLTARGYATNLSIVSAHLAGNRFNSDWLPLLHFPKHTVVVLMGLSFAEQIAQAALQESVPGTMPVAIISNASRANQQIILSSINSLAADGKKADKPAILVFGAVVTLQYLAGDKDANMG
ncbi:MAG: uroporphyrinogen-III C-methyltransferase [Desulfuromonas sp.]|nr:uroporphyrinogen-III C-methyltransferase [Desulfuromonas sp.]